MIFGNKELKMQEISWDKVKVYKHPKEREEIKESGLELGELLESLEKTGKIKKLEKENENE